MSTDTRPRYTVRDQETGRLICRRATWDSAVANARRTGRACWVRDERARKTYRF